MQINLRLVKASQFLCRFNLDVRYKPGKENIVPDALSQLVSTNTSKLPKDYNKLDTLTMIDIQFKAVLVKINDKFQKQIFDRYKKNNW